MRGVTRWTLLSLLLCARTNGFAQSINSGDIRGTVTDSSGAKIAGATVTVLNVDTGVSKDYTTDAAGLSDTSSIVAGSYKITFTKDGFDQTMIRSVITRGLAYTSIPAPSVASCSTSPVTMHRFQMYGTSVRGRSMKYA